MSIGEGGAVGARGQLPGAVSKQSQDLQTRVTPGVNRDLVSSHIGLLENLRTTESAGSDDEEGRLEVAGVFQVLEQARGVITRSIVEGHSPGILLRAVDNVGVSAEWTRSATVQSSAERSQLTARNRRKSTSSWRQLQHP